MKRIEDIDFLERFIIKGILENQKFLSTISSTVNSAWFQSFEAGQIFIKTNEFFKEYKKIPDEPILVNLFEDNNDIKNFISQTKEIDLSISDNYTFLVDETEHWIKASALKTAILESADIINANGNFDGIDKLIKDALAKSIKFDIGTDYWQTLSERLKRKFSETTEVTPSGYPTLDSLIGGGFPAKTLSLLVARTHGFKSVLMINMAIRMCQAGKNVILFSCEMSEDMVNQRIDSIFSGLDINRIYLDKQNELVKELSTLKKSNDKYGTLIVKEFAASTANTSKLSAYLHEMEFRGYHFDAIILDYLNNLLPIRKTSQDGNMYSTLKTVAEEVRALAFEWNIAIISATQFNRGGAKADFDSLSSEDVAESYGISQTADFSMGLGFNAEKAIYTNEINWKIMKNRLGGQIGHTDRFFYDPKSLKIYDGQSEMELWFNDAIKSQSTREVYEKGK